MAVFPWSDGDVLTGSELNTGIGLLGVIATNLDPIGGAADLVGSMYFPANLYKSGDGMEVTVRVRSDQSTATNFQYRLGFSGAGGVFNFPNTGSVEGQIRQNHFDYYNLEQTAPGTLAGFAIITDTGTGHGSITRLQPGGGDYPFTQGFSLFVTAGFAGDGSASFNVKIFKKHGGNQTTSEQFF